MSVQSIAIESYVVPDSQPEVPSGFQVLDLVVSTAIPAELALGDGWTVIPLVPSGSARVWLDADPLALVTSSDVERAVQDPAAPPGPGSAPRLIVRRGGAPVAAFPLVAGITNRAWSEDGGAGSLLELIPIAWEIRVASLLGTEPPRAQLTLAWRTQFPAHFEEA